MSSAQRASNFEDFVGQFGESYRVARADRARTTPHLDVLQAFGLSVRELCHSRLLSWFLRADGEHEQGALFLNALLKLVHFPSFAGENYHVLLEKPERVDVSIYAEKNFAIFIENKVYAKEQPTQFERLVKSLRGFCDRHHIPAGRRTAIFLTNDGRAPLTRPGEMDATITDINLRRDQLFTAFDQALQTSKRKSLLLEHFLAAYIRGIAKLT